MPFDWRLKSRNRMLLCAYLAMMREEPNRVFDTHTSHLMKTIVKGNDKEFWRIFYVSSSVFETVLEEISLFLEDGNSRKQNIPAGLNLGIWLLIWLRVETLSILKIHWDYWKQQLKDIIIKLLWFAYSPQAPHSNTNNISITDCTRRNVARKEASRILTAVMDPASWLECSDQPSSCVNRVAILIHIPTPIR